MKNSIINTIKSTTPIDGRADLTQRLKWMANGTNYSMKTGWSNRLSAVWFYTLSDFEDPAWYNEIGRDCLPAATQCNLDDKRRQLWNSMSPIEKLINKLLLWFMLRWLDMKCFDQPHSMFVRMKLSFKKLWK